MSYSGSPSKTREEFAEYVENISAQIKREQDLKFVPHTAFVQQGTPFKKRRMSPTLSPSRTDYPKFQLQFPTALFRDDPIHTSPANWIGAGLTCTRVGSNQNDPNNNCVFQENMEIMDRFETISPPSSGKPIVTSTSLENDSLNEIFNHFKNSTSNCSISKVKTERNVSPDDINLTCEQKRGYVFQRIHHLFKEAFSKGLAARPLDHRDWMSEVVGITTFQIDSGINMERWRCFLCSASADAWDGSLSALECNHELHTSCLSIWLTMSGNCPLCFCSAVNSDFPVDCVLDLSMKRK